MIDVHIITLPSSRKEWLMEAAGSTAHAAAIAGFRVDIHIVHGVDGDIGASRSAAYALGSNPYVTYVDHDDFVLPDAFAAMREALQSGAPAIFQHERTIQNGRFGWGWRRHHLCAFRRDVLIDHAAWKACSDLAQVRHAEQLPGIIDLPVANYVHRLYPNSGGHVLRAKNPGELERANG